MRARLAEISDKIHHSGVEKNEWFGEILPHSKADIEGALLKKDVIKNFANVTGKHLVGACF